MVAPTNTSTSSLLNKHCEELIGPPRIEQISEQIWAARGYDLANTMLIQTDSGKLLNLSEDETDLGGTTSNFCGNIGKRYVELNPQKESIAPLRPDWDFCWLNPGLNRFELELVRFVTRFTSVL